MKEITEHTNEYAHSKFLKLNLRPRSIWHERWIDHMPFFSDVFSRDRFLQIHWKLHVTSVAAGNTNKIDMIVKHMKSKSMEYFIPGQDIAIDETMIGFKDRASFRMYSPQKRQPTKWGFRVYTLADSATGYIVTFEPYYGKNHRYAVERGSSFHFKNCHAQSVQMLGRVINRLPTVSYSSKRLALCHCQSVYQS